MKNNIYLNLASIGVLSILVFLATGSVDDSASSQKPIGALAEGNRILINATDKGTTLQRDKLQSEYLGKVLPFEGTIEDVKTANTAIVKIDSGNFANVEFSSAEAENLEVGQQIKFDAAIKEFGSGILVKHDLHQAKLKP